LQEINLIYKKKER